VTSDLVMAEAWTLIASHLGRPAAVKFWEALRDARIPVLPLEATDIEAAWHITQGFRIRTSASRTAPRSR
jgi:hypothetical protein